MHIESHAPRCLARQANLNFLNILIACMACILDFVSLYIVSQIMNFNTRLTFVLVVLALTTVLLFFSKSELAIPALGVTLLTATILVYINLFVISFGSSCLTFGADQAIGMLVQKSHSLACSLPLFRDTVLCRIKPRSKSSTLLLRFFYGPYIMGFKS